MRIISKYKDYYDHMIAYGVDSDIVFERKDTLINHPIKNYRSIKSYKNSEYCVAQFTVFICGYLYDGYCCYMENGKDEFYYNPADVLNYIKQRDPSFSAYWVPDFLKQTEIVVEKAPDNVLSWAKENNVVVGFTRASGNFKFPVSEHSKEFISNCSQLKDIKFQQVLDGMTIFNMISQYIAEVKHPDLYQLSDKEKLVKAGFDNKISFRGKNS